MSKPFSPSCERNRDPILQILLRQFKDRRQVLELGSGTGQHAVHFAAAMPWLSWQCSDQEQGLAGIQLWLDEAKLANTPPALALKAVTEPRPDLAPAGSAPAGTKGYDAAFSANTLHIMSWPQVVAVFRGLDRMLATDAKLAVYGPFNRGGQFSSDSNRMFDGELRARDPNSGIRDLEAVSELAAAIGLREIECIAMPANNLTVIWQRNA